MKRGIASVLLLIACSLLFGGCAGRLDSGEGYPRQFTKMHFASAESIKSTAVDMVGPEGHAIQTLRLMSGKESLMLSDVYGIVVMLPDRPINKLVCEALISNLTFMSEPARTALARERPSTRFRYTILYDRRSSQELSRIPRPEYLSRDDCDELVSNFDFGKSYRNLSAFRINPRWRGPWLIAIDPLSRSALKFDLTQFRDNELDDAVDQWSELLQDRTSWRKREMGLVDYFLGFLGRKPRVELIYLPKDFQP